MSSNALSGERRWAAARRGGMTVLGKVAVPKPLNLPSQRLENHGLDPNVEIVPKGTLSWGSRTSSSGSSAWASSSLSPNTDGGNTSPIHFSGRPSSGGSGTRPSTAGSDKTHEHVTSVWGSNSRPSSASGTLASNQLSSTSLQPRSAETRPNSSQRSRFAEPITESSVAWGPSTTADRLGVKSSKEEGFSLSSGDFPTLSSEKDHASKNSELQDGSRPSSASGRIGQAREKDSKTHSDEVQGTVNRWKADGSRSLDDAIHPKIEKWHGEPQQYFNPNAPPPHFDAWRGPPMNAPGGVWYGGHPRGPAFGAPVPPGGFPMEPFPYYHPQIPPPGLAGSQPLPPPGTGPRGPHPKNGELYRPQMPDSYTHPGMPFRPGFYPGHPSSIAFEGYYGPPMGYGNNEKDIPYMGMGAGPPIYHPYSGPVAPDIGNPHGRDGGRGPSGKAMSEHVQADHLEDAQGPKRAPLKNHPDWDRRGDNKEYDVHTNASNAGKGRLPMLPPRKSEWGAEDDVEEDIFAKRASYSESPARNFDYRGHSSDSFKVKPGDEVVNMRTLNENWNNKSENMAPYPPQMLQPTFAPDTDSSLLPAAKDTAPMQKREGLNAKLHASDGIIDIPKSYSRKEESHMTPGGDLSFGNEVNNAAGSSFERTPASRDSVPVYHEVISSVGNKPIQSAAVVSRTSFHTGYRGKGKFNSQDTDGRRRKHFPPEFSITNTALNTELPFGDHSQDLNFIRDVGVTSMNSSGKVDGDSPAETHDSTEIRAQRAKMKELAKQRALQLQKEEEERTREQKAKALAKLEELNRRTQAGEVVNPKTEGTQVSAVGQGAQEVRPSLGESVRVDPNFQAPNLDLVSKPDVMERSSNINKAGESVEGSKNVPLDASHTDPLGWNASERHPFPSKDDVHDASAKHVVPQVSDGVITRHQRTGYKQKQNNPLQKSLNEKAFAIFPTEAQKDAACVVHNDVSVKEASSSEIKPTGGSHVSMVSNVAAESSAHQRKRSNRSKNRLKQDENPAITPATSDIDPKGVPIEGNDCNAVSIVEPERQMQAPQASSSMPIEEVPSKMPYQGKTQSSRKQQRNQQGNRFMDKLHGSDTVMWAPVCTHSKADNAVEAGKKSSVESFSSTNSDNPAPNSSKGKRAEMERYVPKPVAKELAQQGCVPSLSSSVNSSKSDEPSAIGQSGSDDSASPRPLSSTSAFVGSTVEAKEGDGKHHMHRKEHGTWRQRGSTDSHMKVMLVSEVTGDIQEQHQSVKSEMDLTPAETITFGTVGVWEPSPSKSNMTTALKSKSSAVKDQGTTGREKRHHPRGPRTGHSLDYENNYGGETEASYVQSARPDVDQTNINVDSKESRPLEERSPSHWQPKSRSNSVNNHKTVESETATTEINKSSKVNPQRKVQVSSQHDMEVGDVDRRQRGQSAYSSVGSEKSVVVQHLNREKKPTPAKGRPFSPNQDPVGSKSVANSHTDGHPESSISSGTRKSGNHSRTFRGHEPRGEWSSGHDNRGLNATAFRERHRQNAHYEYQPVGASRPEKLEELRDGANNDGPRYKVKGPSHHKHGGNYYRRQSDAAPVESHQV